MPYYRFKQSNSGGAFDTEQGYSVFVEAASPEAANTRAETVGIYFDGVSSGMDCSCCGDRWSETDEYDLVTDLKKSAEDDLFWAKGWGLQIGWLPLSSSTLLMISAVTDGQFLLASPNE
jgi:hypothetical protein